MATLGTNAHTLVDIAKLQDPDGKIALIAELLSQTNEIFEDIKYVEANKSTSHVYSLRTSLPTPAWRRLNEGIAPSKSTAAQAEEACAMLEAWSEVDKDLAELNGNSQAFRFMEAKAHFEAMTQEFVGTLFYGNSSLAPEEFTGFAPRYNSLSGTNGQNIISGGGSGSDNSSVWLIGWGDNTVHGIYPKGSKAGLFHEDLGLVTVETTAGVGGNRMRAYQDHFQMKCGLVVKDWRYVSRGCNIDVSNLVAKSSAADLVEMMIKMTYRIPNLKAVKPAFYMNRSCIQMLDIFRRDDVMSGGQLSYDVVDGKMQTSFRGIPVRLCDQLTETESAVS